MKSSGLNGRQGTAGARRLAGLTAGRPGSQKGAGGQGATDRTRGTELGARQPQVGPLSGAPGLRSSAQSAFVVPRSRFGLVGAARAERAGREFRIPSSTWFPPARKQEHGSHPLQRLARGHPRLLPANSSCGSAEYPGEAIPHHPGLPKADPGHWWASFFFGKSTLPFMATVLESPEHSESAQASTSRITCDLAREAVGKQQPSGQPGKTNCRPPS